MSVVTEPIETSSTNTSTQEANTQETKQEAKQETIKVDGIKVVLLHDAVQLEMDKGIKKFISYEEFLHTINSTMNPDDVEVSNSYHLAPGTFLLEAGRDAIKVAMYYPECYREITYMNTTRLSVIPNIVISHTLKKSTATGSYSVTNTNYMCTSRKLSELPRVFPMLPSRHSHKTFCTIPFTNVYNDGKLCYGNNVRVANITLPDMRPLHWYYDMLFTSPFNNDLGIYSLATRIDYSAWYTKLADLAKQNKPFPYESLVSGA